MVLQFKDSKCYYVTMYNALAKDEPFVDPTPDTGFTCITNEENDAGDAFVATSHANSKCY